MRRPWMALRLDPLINTQPNALALLEAPTLLALEDDFGATLHLELLPAPLVDAPVSLHALHMIIRDEDQRLLDRDTAWLDHTLEQPAPMTCAFTVARDVIDQAHALTLVARYEYDIARRIADGACHPPTFRNHDPHRVRWPIALQPAPSPAGASNVDLTLSAFSGYGYGPLIELFLELREQPASRDPRRDLTLRLLDAQGDALTTLEQTINLVAGEPTLLKVPIDLDLNWRPLVRGLSIDLAGRCIHEDILGHFTVCPARG